MSWDSLWDRWQRWLLRKQGNGALLAERDAEKVAAEREARELERALAHLRRLRAERDLYQRRAG